MAELKHNNITCQEQRCDHHCRSDQSSCINNGNNNNNNIHLYREIEHLKRQLAEREYHIVQMETNIMHHAKQFPNGELTAMQDSMRYWQEKYERLLEGHRKLQKVNQGLEDKLLRIVDKFETEKSALTRDVSDLTNKLVDARVFVTELEEENEQYRNDCNVAVQLLQCKPSHFVSHKFNTLPHDLQEKVRLQLNHRRTRSSPCNSNGINNATTSTSSNSTQHTKSLSQSSNSSSNAHTNNGTTNGAKIIRVPIPTFPPTAMVYSVENKVAEESCMPLMHSNGGLSGQHYGHGNDNNGPDYVSAAIMAKVLEERSKERNSKRLMKCHQCRNRRAHIQYIDEETQTTNGVLSGDDYLSSNSYYYNSSGAHRQRSESSSSMESATDSLQGSLHGYNSNSYSNSNCKSDRTCNASNETIII